MATTASPIQYGPHAGDVLRGNYKISTDKTGRMIAHRWLRLANRWVRCDAAAALASK